MNIIGLIKQSIETTFINMWPICNYKIKRSSAALAPEPHLKKWDIIVSIKIGTNKEFIKYVSENDYGLLLSPATNGFSHQLAFIQEPITSTHFSLIQRGSGRLIGLFSESVFDIEYKSFSKLTVTDEIFAFIEKKHKIESFNYINYNEYTDVKICQKDLTNEEKEELTKYNVQY